MTTALHRSVRLVSAIVTSVGLIASASLLTSPARAEVTAHEGEIEIPTYPWDPRVRHPYFRATESRNIYPYPMLDNLQREKTVRTWKTVVLENDYLRVTFLPELGGKVYEVIDKTTSKPVFYVNQVVKPGLIGQCGAWVSGGIEFNTGPTGHTVSAVLPVDVEILPPAADGSRSVAVGEVEKIYRTRWTVVVTLRPGRSYLEESIRIYNRTDTVRPYYFWNCTAVPNTPGFRFVYPMTLGTDHAGTTFYTWPIADGKDLSLGTSYEDASSIFAYECDQDFFGSYDTDADRGVVAYANHRVLPGKKAWTWGQGSYGRMHQMDLTDDDGPYNEVQTGPLPTQADVGRLDPHEVVAWREWWYPVHGVRGFTFATRDVAVNATARRGGLELRALGTGTWDPVDIRIAKGGDVLASRSAAINPSRPTVLKVDLGDVEPPFEIDIRAGPTVLATFEAPLELPLRQPPKARPDPETASELVQSGWQDFLFARFAKAREVFQRALESDPRSATARAGLAYLDLERDPVTAAEAARAALAVDPDSGLARHALAVAEFRLGDLDAALADAFKAALDPATAVVGRSLAARILLRKRDHRTTIQTLSAPGPWRADPRCRNYLALALLESHRDRRARRLVRQSLADDPLDAFARSLLEGGARKGLGLGELIGGKAQSVLELACEYSELGRGARALGLIETFYASWTRTVPRDPIPLYWAAWLTNRLGRQEGVPTYLESARELSADGVFPHRVETVPVLRWALETEPRDGKAALYLGHLLFSFGRLAEGRKYWRVAAELGASPVVASRALAASALKIDGDTAGARRLLEEAHRLDSGDAIVARDLARVLFRIADKQSAEEARTLFTAARDALRRAFPSGRGRSDFVALLARAHNRLGEYGETARLLDSVRITIWEGAREVHDLFEKAHVAIGEGHLAASRPADALREFDRALEYPENLATGKLEEAREAPVHWLRGRALEALGRRDEAMAAWRQAAGEAESSDPDHRDAQQRAREALEAATQKGAF